MPTFAVRVLGLPPSAAFAGTFWLGVIQCTLVPVFGALSDRVGRIVVMRASALTMLVIIVPLFGFMVTYPSVPALLLTLTVIGVVASAYWGPISAAMAELFPAHARGTGLSVSYSLGVAIFGGFAPFISTWLIAATGSRIAPAFYACFGAVVSLVALRRARHYGIR